jgi:hypothetical protein
MNKIRNEETWFGNNNGEYILIEQGKLSAGHMLVLGPTGSENEYIKYSI